VTDQNTTSMSQPTGFAVGDRVRIVDTPHVVWNGKTGTITHTNQQATYPYVVRVESGEGRTFIYCLAHELQPHDQALANDLIACASELGAVEFNRWIADGMLCRRFITPDGSIDLTVRVP